MAGDMGFDMQAAWLRRFTADAEGNLLAFARRLQEAMPDAVEIHESRPLFGRARTTGLTVQLGDNRYRLELVKNRLQATIAMEVRGIVISTKAVDPASWFARLAAETQQASEHARALSQSLAAFMEN